MFWQCSTPVSSFWLRSSTYERRLSSTRDALNSWPYKNLQVAKKGTLLTDADGKANKNFKSRQEQVVRKMRSATSPRPVRFGLDHRCSDFLLRLLRCASFSCALIKGSGRRLNDRKEPRSL